MVNMTESPSTSSLGSIHQFTWLSQEVMWTFNAMATTLYAMRMISRIYIRKMPFDWSDYIITLASVMNLCRAAFFQETLTRTRRLRADNFVDELPSALFWPIIAHYWTFLAIPIPKLSLGLLIIQIFNPPRWLRWTIIVSCCVFVASGITGFVFCFNRCSPAAAIWDPKRYPAARCIPLAAVVDYIIYSSAYTIALDVFFTVYPGIVISQLRIPMSQKVRVFVLMSLGVAATVFAIIKTINVVTFLSYLPPSAMLKKNLEMALWSGLENDFVLSAACLPNTVPVCSAVWNWIETQKGTVLRRWHRRSSVLKVKEYFDNKPQF